jgi:hypothetical protein
MSKTKYLKGACQHCGGHLEYQAEHIGMVVPCPHCQQETELLLLPPPQEPGLPGRVLVWTGIAVLVLALGLAAALLALKRAQRWAETRQHQAVAVANTPTAAEPEPEMAATNSSAQIDLSASPVTLEKTPGSSLVYAVGTIQNPSSRQRFGVKVELDLLDASGEKIGTATDYRQLLDPGSQWKFKAMVLTPKAASVRLSSIREDQ